MNRNAAILITCLALASCAPAGGGGNASGNSRLDEACRQAADRAYDTQHRADIFVPMSGVNTPQSNNYAPGSDGRGLSQIFERDNDIRDCVRRGGATATPAAPPRPAPPGPSPVR
jgi:hypothetical protein